MRPARPAPHPGQSNRHLRVESAPHFRAPKETKRVSAPHSLAPKKTKRVSAPHSRESPEARGSVEGSSVERPLGRAAGEAEISSSTRDFSITSSAGVETRETKHVKSELYQPIAMHHAVEGRSEAVRNGGGKREKTPMKMQAQRRCPHQNQRTDW